MIKIEDIKRNYAPGSQDDDWSWEDEKAELLGEQLDHSLFWSIFNEGVKENVLLGWDGRVWDGHHRIVYADYWMIPEVPFEICDRV